MVLVPMFAFHANETSPIWDGSRKDVVFHCIVWVLCAIGAFGVPYYGAKHMFESFDLKGWFGEPPYRSVYYSLIAATLTQFFAKWYGKPLSILSILNPIWWLKVFNWFNLDRIAVEPTSSCSIVARNGSAEDTYANPSTWICHIAFFFGFFFSNAYAIHNEPAPTLKNFSKDPQVNKRRQESLKDRVENRKWITSSLAAVGLVVFLLLLFFRFQKTPCEYPFYLILIPIFYAMILGSCFFFLVFKVCGARPADILGLVQGMVPSDLIDTPVVCVADSTPLPASPVYSPPSSLRGTSGPAKLPTGSSMPSASASASAVKGVSYAYAPNYRSESDYIFGPDGTFLTAGKKNSVAIKIPTGTSGPDGPTFQPSTFNVDNIDMTQTPPDSASLSGRGIQGARSVTA